MGSPPPPQTSEAVGREEALQVQVGVEGDLEVFGGLPQQRDLEKKRGEGVGGALKTPKDPKRPPPKNLPRRLEARCRPALVFGGR